MRKLHALTVMSSLALALTGLNVFAADVRNNNDDRFFRVDCEFHNIEKIPGVSFCYASAVYKVDDGRFKHVRFGVGCDGQTLYNNSARVVTETVQQRIQPETAATPALEVPPQDSLSNPTTYFNSFLDTRNFGRMMGTCYVQKLHDHDNFPTN